MIDESVVNEPMMWHNPGGSVPSDQDGTGVAIVGLSYTGCLEVVVNQPACIELFTSEWICQKDF